jgi:hypothetical protein
MTGASGGSGGWKAAATLPSSILVIIAGARHSERSEESHICLPRHQWHSQAVIANEKIIFNFQLSTINYQLF